MNINQIKLIEKYIVKFEVVCKTGLHIGGSDSGTGIGEVDLPVLLDPVTKYPYICGSSLKGRMRERLEWLFKRVHSQVEKLDEDFEKEQLKAKEREKEPTALKEIIKELEEKRHSDVLSIRQCNCGKCDICHYFGHSNRDWDEDDYIPGPTRFIFRDALPAEEQIQKWDKFLGNGVYTEIKIENTISRLTATANPRSLERVPAGSRFPGEVVIDIYGMPAGIPQDDGKIALNLLLKGMVAIENSYLGGQGSRGSGQVEFVDIRIQKFPASHFTMLEGEVKTYDQFGEKNTATQIWEQQLLNQLNQEEI